MTGRNGSSLQAYLFVERLFTAIHCGELCTTNENVLCRPVIVPPVRPHGRLVLCDDREPLPAEARHELAPLLPGRDVLGLVRVARGHEEGLHARQGQLGADGGQAGGAVEPGKKVHFNESVNAIVNDRPLLLFVLLPLCSRTVEVIDSGLILW